MNDKPFLLDPSRPKQKPIPFVRPLLPDFKEVEAQFQEILSTGMVTTGSYAEQLGERVAAFLGVKHAVAVSSCTTGLLLAIQSLGLPKGSEVILPSFTFMASGIGPVWNQLKLRFVDVDCNTMNIDPHEVEKNVTESTSAILGVHQFGNPAPIEDLETIARKHNLALLFDSAHGFGSFHHGQPVGRFGQGEVFSMSPTKLMIAAEGGVVATNDAQVAEHVRIGRNYGNPGNYDCLFPGLNARMSEFHAIVAMHSMDKLEMASKTRNEVAERYRQTLSTIPGIGFQAVAAYDRSSYKDFCIVVEEKEFGLSRDLLVKALQAEEIQTRVYYSPVLHRMKAFAPFGGEKVEASLPHTRFLQESALSLPMYSNMTREEVDCVSEAILRIHRYADEIRNKAT